MNPTDRDFESQYKIRKQFYRDHIEKLKQEKLFTQNNVFSFRDRNSNHSSNERKSVPTSAKSMISKEAQKLADMLNRNGSCNKSNTNEFMSFNQRCAPEIEDISNFRDSSEEKSSRRNLKFRSKDKTSNRALSNSNRRDPENSNEFCQIENLNNQNQTFKFFKQEPEPTKSLLNQEGVITLIGNQLQMQKVQKWEIINSMHKLQIEKNEVIREMREREKQLIERVRELEVSSLEKDEEINLLRNQVLSDTDEKSQQEKSTNYDSNEHLHLKIQNLEDKVDTQAQMIIKLKRIIEATEKEKQSMSSIIKEYITKKS